jgi:hypothetical protein
MASTMFSGCSNLQSVAGDIFAASASLADASSMFSGCTSLQTVPAALFANCPALSNAQRMFESSGVTDGGVLLALAGKNLAANGMDYCLYNAQGIAEIAEADWTGITFASYNLSNYSYVFYGMNGLRRVTVPADVQFLSYGAIPSTVDWVEFKAATPPGVNSSTLTGSYPVYVPDGAVDTYKAAPGWDMYADRIAAVSERNV